VSTRRTLSLKNSQGVNSLCTHGDGSIANFAVEEDSPPRDVVCQTPCHPQDNETLQMVNSWGVLLQKSKSLIQGSATGWWNPEMAEKAQTRLTPNTAKTIFSANAIGPVTNQKI
jgi:hypothetical protein